MFGQAKILVSLLQIIASMPFVLTGVQFPPFFKSVANAFGAFNLDVLALSSVLHCQYSVRFFDRVIIHLMLPVCCVVSIRAAAVTVRACVSKSKARAKHVNMNQVVSKMVVLVVLLIFPGLSTRLFSVFKCTRFAGVEDDLLVADYAIDCGQEEHAAFVSLAVVFVVVYIVGIPCTMLLLLWWNKKYLHDVDSAQHLVVKNALGDLYLQYEPDYWWFELMVMFNKTIMCGGLVVLSPGSPSQVLCGVLFMLFHLLVVLKLSPFSKHSEDLSSVAAALGLTLIYIGALMKMLEDVYKNVYNNMDGQGMEQYDQANMSYIGTALDALPLICVGVVVGIIVVMDCGLYDCCCKKKKKKKQKQKQQQNGQKKGNKPNKQGKGESENKEMKVSDVDETNAQQSKTVGAKPTQILPAPMVGGTSKSLVEEQVKRKRSGRGVLKKAQTQVVEL